MSSDKLVVLYETTPGSIVRDAWSMGLVILLAWINANFFGGSGWLYFLVVLLFLTFTMARALKPNMRQTVQQFIDARYGEGTFERLEATQP